MRLSSVCFVLDMEVRLGRAGRYVDPVFQHSQRNYMGFVRDLVKADSFDFVADAVEHVGLFFVVQKAGAERFIVDARTSNRYIHLGRCSQVKDFVM